MNILIVEDEPHIEKLLVSCVTEAAPSAAVYTTGQSAEALELAEQHAIDIFILDIQLTDYKGTELARQLRAMERYAYTPILFATALANEELTAYREIKCYSFLIKPFTKEEVVGVLRDTIKYRMHLAPEERKPRMLRIEQRNHIMEYEQDKILYVESFGKHLELHIQSVGGEIRTDRISGISLKKMAELLDGELFVQCHKSYIINLSYLSRIDKSGGFVELSGVRSPVPIGNKYRDALLHRGET